MHLAQIQVNGVQHYLGTFSTQREAHAAYRQAARRFGRAVVVGPAPAGGAGGGGGEGAAAAAGAEEEADGDTDGEGGQEGHDGGGVGVWVGSAEDERVLQARVRLGHIVGSFLSVTEPMAAHDMDAYYTELEVLLAALGYIRVT